jgi:hypothetical protein
LSVTGPASLKWESAAISPDKAVLKIKREREHSRRRGLVPLHLELFV